MTQTGLMRAADTISRATFRYAAITARYTPPKLMFYAKLWITVWIPLVRGNSDNKKYGILCKRNEYFLEHGWELGELNPDKKLLNNDSYDSSTLPLEAQWAIRNDLTDDLLNGRITQWLGNILGETPLFTRAKKLHPITDVVLKWRVIRDGSHARFPRVSINELTPDEVAALVLVTHDLIRRYLIIMYMLYGEGCYLGKADLKSAFRQFYWRKGETEKIIYKFENQTLGDLQHIWGTRSGSRICQDMTQVVSRTMMLLTNGPHLRVDIDKAKEEGDVSHFRNKLDYGAKFCPKLRRPAIDIWNWTKQDVDDWLKEVNLENVSQIMHEKMNGRTLMFMHETRARLILSKDKVLKLKSIGFFDKLLKLKLDSHSCIRMIVEAYVDDFMFILPPDRAKAEAIFEDNCDFINENGFEEEKKKREKIDVEMEFLGIVYNTRTMQMSISAEKRDRMKRLLARGLMGGTVTTEQYESIVGKLSYAAQLMWPAKSFLRRMRDRLQQVIAQHGRRQYLIILTEWEKKDWRWWIKYMDTISHVSILQLYNPRRPTDEIFVDGATNGSRERGWNPAIGVWYKGHSISIKVPRRYQGHFRGHNDNQSKEYAIAHFEMLAIIVALHNLKPYLTPNALFTIRTDSKHAESALRAKSSRDEFLMDGVRWTTMWAVEWDARFHIDYVNTKDNTMADLLSRFEHRKFMGHANKICAQKGWKHHHISKPVFPDFQCW